MSSLSRAFTTRRSKTPSDAGTSSLPQRSLTTKHSLSSGGTIRYKISAPVELLSTTNMLSYNAPDIYSTSRSRSSSSGSESVSSSTSPQEVSTPMTSPDSSSIESSPTSPKPNHLSCYFGSSSSSDEAPKIPQRVPSHTKRSAEALAHKRSMSKMSSPKSSMSTARSSLNMFSGNLDTVEAHPFGNELAQVSELAEEYGIAPQKMEFVDAEEQELVSQGFFKFRAEDYMSEIHSLFVNAFHDGKPLMSTMWI